MEADGEEDGGEEDGESGAHQQQVVEEETGNGVRPVDQLKEQLQQGKASVEEAVKGTQGAEEEGEQYQMGRPGHAEEQREATHTMTATSSGTEDAEELPQIGKKIRRRT